MLTRRTLLTVLSSITLAGAQTALGERMIDSSPREEWKPGWAVLADGTKAPESVQLQRLWHGRVCHSSLHNSGKESVRIREIVLFSLPHRFAPETLLYGE